MLDRLQTFVVVALVTVLVWFFAENKVVEEVTLPPVRIEAADMDNISVRFNPPAPTVTIQMKGPTHAINEVRTEIERSGIVVRPGRDGVPAEPGVYDIPMLDFLRSNPVTANRGVSIVSVDPAVLKEVVVDRWVERTIDVQPGEIESVETDGPATVSPSTVRVLLAESILDQIDVQRLRAVAVPIETARLNNLAPGEPHTIDAVLTLEPEVPDYTKYELGTTTARMTFRVRTARSEVTLNGVAIQLVLTPQDQARYRIELEEMLIPQLTVTGPSGTIEKIAEREIPVIGYLMLSSDELFRRISEKTISFSHLPPGVTVSPSPITVQFDVARKDDPSESQDSTIDQP